MIKSLLTKCNNYYKNNKAIVDNRKCNLTKKKRNSA